MPYEYQPYPRMYYRENWREDPTTRTCVVQDEQEEAALSGEWSRHPTGPWFVPLAEEEPPRRRPGRPRKEEDHGE